MSKKNIISAISLVFVIGVFLAGFFPGAFRPKTGKGQVAYYNGQTISRRGLICAEADVDYKSRKLTVCPEGLSGRILVTTKLYPEYDYGDFVSLSGRLESPPRFAGFDYGRYLARYGVYSVMYYPKISLSRGSLGLEQRTFRALLHLKQSLKRAIDSRLKEPEAGLADAILLGYNHTVIKEDLATFSRVGISHLIAISGSHITIMSAMVIDILLGLGLSRRRALWFVFAFLFLYPLVTGMAASAVRSAIMGAISFLAVYRGRSVALGRSLLLSAAMMLLGNPRLLRDDVGFQLSFAAVLGIIYLYPFGARLSQRFLRKRRWREPAKKIVSAGLEAINLTTVSQIAILPIALVNFQQLSIIAPLANLVTLWTFPFILGSLLAALFLSGLIPSLGLFFFWPSYLLLKFIFLSSNLLAQPSWAAVSPHGFNWGWGGVYYLVLAGLILLTKKKSRPTM